MTDKITLQRLGPEDLGLLLAVAPGLFDNAIREDQAKAFLHEPLHDMVLALADGNVVGMASGQFMLHPDKPPAYFINEVGVRETYQRQGIATRLCDDLIKIAHARGCEGVWVATEGDNTEARALYRSMGARETRDIVVYDWGDRALDR